MESYANNTPFNARMAKTIYQNRYEHFRDLLERYGGQAKIAERMERPQALARAY